MKALALVDSDSYAKWGAAMIAILPFEWERRLAVVATPVRPSAAQMDAALRGSGFTTTQVDTLELADVVTRVRSEAPDVVIVSMRGPAASVVMRELARLDPRPVLVSGLPGISIPATWKALFYRGQADLVVLHSKREIRDFTVLAAERGWNHRLGLATLPFIERQPVAGGRDIVFAAQAIVPIDLVDRERVLDILVETAERNPDHRVVIKLRAVRGEQQTHAETHGFAELLVDRERVPDNLVVANGPMSVALESAAGLVTISSTAAIEAAARGVAVIALDEFGISPALINEVFVGSGMLASGEACTRLEFGHADPAWMDDNYLHDPRDNDWITALGELVAARSRGDLPARVSLRPGGGGALRLAWERRQAFGALDRTASGALALAIGMPARSVVRVARRVRRAVPAGRRSSGR